MMKIGIMTFHWAANHGALLQTYALQRTLEKIIPDCETVVIDYKPARYDMSLKRAVHSRSPKAIRNNLREMKKERILAPFRDTIPKTYRYYSVEQLMRRPPNCDVFIAGSDQIWNEFFTMKGEGKKTSAYFLPFHPGAKHISYAASFGTTELKPEMKAYILPYLQKMDGISVREQTGKALLDQMGVPAQIVCDPSGLLDRQVYQELSKPAFPGAYTAKYFLRSESPAAKNAIRCFGSNGAVNDISLLPMEQWLGAIRDASFLLTNSFHGMMAALKLHTPFAVFLTEGTLSGMNDRFYTILSKLELEDRIVSNENSTEVIVSKEIYWEQVDRRLEEYAAESRAFLEKHCIPSPKTGPVTQYRNAECCGCTACERICPTQSIQMAMDHEGFQYPQVQVERCIRCGKCVAVCPVKNNPISQYGHKVEQAWLARTYDQELLRESSSGGVFSVLAQDVLANGGVVFSVAMSDDCTEAVYIKAEDLESLATMRGSKYVQSRKNDVFTQVRHTLAAHRQVLFCGTPCDVNGLYNYLHQTRTCMDNLFLVDFICHGVPSPLIWKRYVEHREKGAGAGARSAQFRNKDHGWNGFSMRMLFANGRTYLAAKDRDEFLKGFLSDLYLRPSCHECHAKGMERVSDMTLGDAWGLEAVCGDFNDDCGISLVMLHTEKAKTVFLKLQNQLQCFPLDSPEQAVKTNTAMIRSSGTNSRRTGFMAQLSRSGRIDKLIRVNCRDPFVLAMKKKIKRMIRGCR